MKIHSVFILATIVAVLASIVACSAAQNARLLSMTASECEKIARANGRDDIALACGIAESAVPVVAAALADTTCTLPDAGGQ